MFWDVVDSIISLALKFGLSSLLTSLYLLGILFVWQ